MERAEITAGTDDREGLALVMTGGGARAAYQVGSLRYLARRYPALRFPILTGVSAGAVNAAHLAQHRGGFARAVQDLSELWTSLTPEQVFRVDAPSLFWNIARSGLQLVSGGGPAGPRVKGMVDTGPLREFLEEALQPERGELTGIEHNLARGTLQALAINTTSYTTGESLAWVQGRDIELWERPKRRSKRARMGIEHVMASTALPLFFPAVQIGDEWHGDGGIRLTAPLSPALHLGANRIMAVSTRYQRSAAEGVLRNISGYPPPAQVMGVLFNSIFLDLIDQDMLRMERMNRVLEGLPVEKRAGMRVVDLLVLRPSQDLGKLAREYEPRLPATFRFLSRSLGTRETTSPDLMSMVMFQGDYLRRLIELGEADAAARAEEIDAFVSAG